MNLINRTHERALRALYEDYESTFEEILDGDKSKTTHEKDLQILVRCVNSPEHMSEFFTKKIFPQFS